MRKKTILIVAITLMVSLLLGPRVMWTINSALGNANSLMYNIERLEDRFDRMEQKKQDKKNNSSYSSGY